MKFFYLLIPSLFGIFLSILPVSGQKNFSIQLEGQQFELRPNISEFDWNQPDWQGKSFEGMVHVVIHFDAIPNQQVQDEMALSGLELLSYLPVNGYLARIPEGFSKNKLINFGVKSIYTTRPEWKISKELSNPVLLPPSAKEGNKIKLVALATPDFKSEKFQKTLEKEGFKVVGTKENTRWAFVLLDFEELKILAAKPYVEWLEAFRGEEIPNNLPGINTHRAGILNSSMPGQRNLKGQGVTVGVGDGGYVRPHFDFNNGRLVNMIPATYSSYTDHGDHVSGTVGGGGVLNPFATGMAPACTILTRQSSDIVTAGPSYFSNFGMILTNNSYGFGISCPTTGGYSTYTSTSNFVDNQLRNTPKLLHCFAASNDGGVATCGSYSGGFGTISLGYGTAKNALVVGAVSETDALAGFSSRGPTADGRVKPEICGVGTSVLSTIPNNTYGSKQGTSMATPGVTGTLALLYQRFRQLNSNQNPDAALIKAVACNTADDLGNANVDFRHGYGRINALRAVQCLETNRYYSNSISQGATQDVVLNIPSGLNQIRVMLYWHDREASSGASPSLVNNLNLQLIDPGTIIYDPWILDPAPANCNNVAVRGVDNLNNIEQVTLNNPAAGNYTIRVTAPTVPFGPQSYYVVYEYLSPSISLTYPTGGEILPTTAARNITWNVTGLSGGNLVLEYSSNGGSSWTTINNAISVTATRFSWNPGAGLAPSNNVITRVRHSTSGTSSTSSPFTLAGWPTLTSSVCDRHIYLSWAAITGATSYEIYHFPNGTPELVTSTAATSFNIPNLTNGVEYYYAVRPVFGGGTFFGERSAAARATPSASTACPVANDVGIVSILPISGRPFTSTSLSASQTIQVVIKNYGSNAQTGIDIPIFYKINGGPTQSSIFNGTLASNTSTANIAFPGTQNLSAVGTYSIEAWTELPGDQNLTNNIMIQEVRQLANPAVNLPVTESFESFINQTLRSSLVGIAGSNAWDYSPNSANSRLRTQAFALSGSKSITMDRAIQSTSTTINHLIYTLNLSNHSTASRLLLNFDYLHHNEEVTNANDRVWARGTDAQAWVQIYDLFANQASAGIIKQVRNLDIKALLGAQTIGSSFQLRFGQEGVDAAVIATMKGGYTFDNIQVVDPGTDLAVSAMSSPSGNCLSPGNFNLTVQVQNTSNSALTNVPIRYTMDGGAVVSSTIPNLPANTTTAFTFPAQVNLTGGPLFTFKIWTEWAGPSPMADMNPLNDTLQNTVAISNVTYPYLQNFETNNGGFTVTGTTTSWAWGSPSSSNVILKSAASGSKIWATNLSGFYNAFESSQIQSPCFNLSSFNAGNLPVLSFSISGNTEIGYDFAWVEYSTNGSTWTKLGVVGGVGSTNWYNGSANQTWEGNLSPWRVASYIIPSAALSATTQFRFVLTADNTIQEEGLGIDNFHITPNILIHNTVGDLSNRTVASTGSGNWLFFTNASGERIAGIRDVNNMGTVSLNVRQVSGSPRTYNNVLYLNRNFRIDPSIAPSQPVPVRLFFLNSEVENLRSANPNLASYVGLIPTKYSGLNENFTPDDNEALESNFTSYPNVSLVPYHNGYYAEFSINSFSEFYLAGEPLFQEDGPLPLVFRNFTAKSRPESALLEWSFSETRGVENLILLVSENGLDFETYDVLASPEPEKNYSLSVPRKGNRLYFRLMWKDENGKNIFSPIRRVDWLDGKGIGLYPNPAKDKLQLLVPGLSGKQAVFISDALGRKWEIETHFEAGKAEIQVQQFSKGMYMLRVGEEFPAGQKLVLE
jgi:hypothetical protein